MPTQTAADRPMERNATAPGRGLGPSGWEVSSGSLTRVGAHDDATGPRMRLLRPYAVRGAPESIVRGAAWAASDEARWTGYTGLIIASRPVWRPNGHDGNLHHLSDGIRHPGRRLECPGRGRSSSSSPYATAQPRVEERVEADAKGRGADRDEGVDLVHEEREQQEAREDRRPRPQDDDAAARPVAEAQQAVVDVLLVRGVEAGPAGGAADEGERHVDEGDPQDEDRDEQGREEEVGHAADRHGGGDATADHHGRRRHQQAEEVRAGVTHEDPRRVEVEWQEPEADPARDHRHQRLRCCRWAGGRGP